MNLSDRFKAALEALVLRICGKYDYAVPYACRVIAQNPDGTLELVPDDPRFIVGAAVNQPLPGLSAVPIRYGAPGVTATVGTGARVIVEFENADPARPVVTAWDLSSPLVMLTMGGGNQPVARVGDLTQAGGPGQFIIIGAPGTGVPPNQAVVAGLPYPVSFTVDPAAIPGTPLAAPLFGVIVTGATNVQS